MVKKRSFRLNLLRIIIAPVVIALVLSSGLVTSTNNAGALKSSEMNSDQKIQSLILYRSIGFCLKNAGMRSSDGWTLSQITQEDAKAGQWFNDRANGSASGVATPGAYFREVSGVGEDFKIDCDDPSLVKKALVLWGVSAEEILCNSGLVRSNDKGGNVQNCINGNGNFERKEGYNNLHGWYGQQGNDASAALYESYILNKVYSKLSNYNPIDGWSGADWYNYYLKTFNQSCAYNSTTIYNSKAAAGNDGRAYNIHTANSDGTVNESQWIRGVEEKTTEIITRPGNTRSYSEVKRTCDFIIGEINKFVEDYAKDNLDKALTKVCQSLGYKDISAQPHGLYELTACKNGFNEARKTPPNATYCAITYAPKTYTYYGNTLINSQELEKAACNTGYGIDPKTMEAAVDEIIDDLNKEEEEETAVTSCGIEGIGWIVCPVMSFLGSIADFSFDFLASSFLQTNINILNSDNSAVHPNGEPVSTATYDAWQVMRNIANIAFVIVFLIIIFSQLSSIGITNYGVKKMLPRLIIGAVLVNISFFVCQIAVDISNILGYSIKEVFDSLGAQMNTVPPGEDASGNGFGIAVIITGIIAGAASLVLAVSFPVILAVILAVLMIVLILVARTALIVMLAIISPLAFVAYLLPNTEQWFKKWGKMFFALLMVFPVIAVVFGASSLASGVINSSSQGDVLMQLLAIGVAAVPFFIVPSLLKGSLNAAGSIGTKLSSMSSKAGSRIGSKVGSTTALGALNKSRQLGASRRQARVQGALARAIPGKAGRRMVATGQAAAIQGEQEDIKMEQAALQKEIDASKAANPNFDSDGHLMSKAVSGSKSQRAAAMHMLAGAGRDKAIRQLQSNPNADKAALQRAVSANGGALAAKAPDLVKGPNAAFGSVSGEDLSKFSADTGRAYMEHLQGLHAKASAPGATQADQQALADATTSFNSAVEDISNNPTLQAAFSGDTGANILKAVKGPGIGPATAFQAYAESRLGSVAGFNDNGKIR